MKKGWNAKNFSECAYRTRDGCDPQNLGDETIFIGLNHIGKGTLRLKSMGKSSDVTSTKYKFSSGDILFGKLNPKFRKVIRPNFSGICSTDILVIRAKPGTDQGFLFYLMGTKNFVDKASGGSQGTGLIRTKWEYMEDFKESFPTEDEQRKIAFALEILDRKIENNISMNKTLNNLADLIFQNWFINYEFLDETKKPYKTNGGKFKIKNKIKIPINWNVGPFKTFGKIQKGFSYKGTEKFLEPQGHAFITLNNILLGGGFKTSYSWVKSERLKDRHYLHEDDLIIANTHFGVGGLNVSRLLACPALVIFPHNYSKSEGVFSHHISKISPSSRNRKIYLYLLIKNRQKEIASAYHTGTSVKGFDANNFEENFLILYPPDSLLDTLDSIVKPLFDRIALNKKQISILQSFRDLFHEKLILGVIPIQNLSRRVN